MCLSARQPSPVSRAVTDGFITEIVIQEVQARHRDVPTCLLGMAVCGAGEAAHTHTHGKVLALNVRRADTGFVRVAADTLPDPEA